MLLLKTPCRDGTTHVVLSPLEFMQYLIGLVSRPRLNLIRFHSVFVANAKLRTENIPGTKKSKPPDSNDNGLRSVSIVRISWARLLKRVFDINMEVYPHRGRKLKVIAAILDSGVITMILEHLGLPTRTPPSSSELVSGFFKST